MTCSLTNVTDRPFLSTVRPASITSFCLDSRNVYRSIFGKVVMSAFTVTTFCSTFPFCSESPPPSRSTRRSWRNYVSRPSSRALVWDVSACLSPGPPFTCSTLSAAWAASIALTPTRTAVLLPPPFKSTVSSIFRHSSFSALNLMSNTFALHVQCPCQSAKAMELGMKGRRKGLSG